jgi:hypothetical protein
MKRLVIITIAFFWSSCHSQNRISINHLGRTAEFNRDENTVVVNFNSKLKRVKLNVDKSKTYGRLVLANTTDDFLVVEYSQNSIGRTVEGDIVRFDANGKLTDKVFDAKTGELIGSLCLSKEDSKLLFTLQTDNFNPSDPLSQLNRPVSILIMDFPQRKIVKRIDSIGMSLSVWINATPWLKDESQFIYDFRTDRKIQMADEPSFDTMMNRPGIHLYNLRSNKDSLLIPDGFSGVVSPIEDKIAYLKDKKIYTHDMDANYDELLYTLAPDERVASVSWTSNGQFIRFSSWRVSGADEVLIRISDKRKMTIK